MAKPPLAPHLSQWIFFHPKRPGKIISLNSLISYISVFFPLQCYCSVLYIVEDKSSLILWVISYAAWLKIVTCVQLWQRLWRPRLRKKTWKGQEYINMTHSKYCTIILSISHFNIAQLDCTLGVHSIWWECVVWLMNKATPLVCCLGFLRPEAIQEGLLHICICWWGWHTIVRFGLWHIS